MRRALSWACRALLVAACLAYQYGVHASFDGAPDGWPHMVMLWAPLALVAAWALARSRHKSLWLAGLLAAGAAIYLAEHHERLGLAAVTGIAHAACYLFLLWFFGRTLAPGREPIITRLARRVHGALEPPMALFTRRLTIAWCVFYAAQLAGSALLAAWAPLHAWSLFVNVLNVPLLALMFAGQFVFRALRHPDYPQASPWQVFQAFTKDASLFNRAEVR
jgi:uncharacterized membrane protein